MSPSLPASQGDTAQLCRKARRGIRSPPCCTCRWRSCIRLLYNPQLKCREGSWSSLGGLAERGRLCRQRGDQLSASPIFLSSAFSSFLICLWPKRRAFLCSAPLPGRSGSGHPQRVGMRLAWGGCCSCRNSYCKPPTPPCPGCSPTALHFLCRVCESGHAK